MALFDSYIHTANAIHNIHLDYNGRHFGQEFSYAAPFVVEKISVKLIYRLNQDGDADAHTNINCGIRLYSILGGAPEGTNLVTATPVSTGELVTTTYYGSYSGADWVEFVFETPVVLTAGTGYCFVLSLDTPTVLDPSPPYSAIPGWGTRTGSGFGGGWIYKTNAGIWTTFNTAGSSFKVEGYGVLPEKAITPGPTHENEAVALDQNALSWVDGGLGEANEATTFNVYYGTTSGDLTLVSSGQAAGVATNAFTVWGVEHGSPYGYAVPRYWRIDSTNAAGTTTGDEWMFTTLPEGYAPPYPPDRPDDYDPDVGGGGEYKVNLLVMGHKVLYFREI